MIKWLVRDPQQVRVASSGCEPREHRGLFLSEDQGRSHGGRVGPEQREAARLDFSHPENVKGVRRFPRGACVLGCV